MTYVHLTLEMSIPFNNNTSAKNVLDCKLIVINKDNLIKMTEKLGEKALEAMKQMDNAVVAFKLPKVPKAKKGQMKILTEEQYIEVSHF